MDRSERCYSVLLVSASQKFTQDVLPLLPERSFSPVVKAADVSSARRCLLERSFDLLIINTPLPDEFGTRLALDICESTQSGVLLLVRAEQYPDVSARVGASGVMTLQKPTNPAIFFFHTAPSVCHPRAASPHGAEDRNARRKNGGNPAVNRAKWILIDQLKMTENEAHKFIERQAMDRWRDKADDCGKYSCYV